MSVTAVRRAVLGALLVGLLAAPATQASNVTVSGDALTVSDPDGANNHLRFQHLADGRVRVEDLNGWPVSGQLGVCTQQGPSAVHCDAFLVGDIESITALLGLGADQNSFLDWSLAAPSVAVDGQGGADLLRAPNVVAFSATLNGGTQDDQLLSADGNDTLNGGDGNDVLTGGNGNDGLNGGANDDLLDGGIGGDTIGGGTGADTLTYEGRSTGMTVSLNDAAPDGDGDTVTQVENVVGGTGNDSLTGNAGANTLTGGPGEDSLFGLDGDDDLQAEDGAADAMVDCGAGANDEVTADQGDPLSGCETQSLPPAPTLSIDDVTVDESAGTATFTVTKSGITYGTVAASFATANGTATAPGDYTATSGSVSFTPVQTTRTITVPIVDDSLDDIADAETFTIALSNPSGAVIVDGSGTGTIDDDEDAPAVRIGNATAAEGDPATFTATLSPHGSERTLTVKATTANGSATSPADYTATTGTVTFAPGTTTAPFAVATAEETLYEGTETFTATLSEPSTGLTLGSPLTGTASITNDDTPPAVSVGTPTATEGGNLVFPLSLDAPSGLPVTLTAATADGTAQAPGDYTATSVAVEFTPGSTARTVTVSTVQDDEDEVAETVVLDATGITGASNTTASGTGTITDDDLPVVSIANAPAATEGSPATFTVSLVLASSEEVTVRLDTSDGTATAPGDYAAQVNRTVTFAPGQTSATVPVATVDDDVDEDNEGFTATLSSPSGARLATGGGASATAQITDGDAAPAATVTGPAGPIVEGDSGTKTATFTVTLSRRSTRGASVRYATADGTATAPSDYDAADGTLSFGPTETTKTVAVTVKGDTLDETHEAFAVGLALPVPDQGKVVLGTPSTANATIEDDDLPTVSVTGGTGDEGDDASFTVSLGLPAPEAASVRLDTSDGSATAPGDYTAVSNRIVTFAPGETTKTVDVPTVDDDIDENAETLTATLSDPSGAHLATGGGATATRTITDDDAAPSATVAGPVSAITEGDGGTKTATFTVNLSRRSERGASVRFATANGTAAAPGDYAANSGTLNFDADQTSRTVAVTVNGDTVDELNETFAVGLALPVPDEGKVTLGTPSSANATIADDDLPVASVTGGAVGEGGTATFTVTLGLPAPEPASVRLDTSDGTAKAPGDYTAVSNRVVTFAPGETSKTVDVPTVDDDVDEDGETLTATLSDPQGALLATGGGSTATATIADGDATPAATVTGPVSAVTEGDSGTTTATFTVSLSRRSERGASVRFATANGTGVAPGDYAANNGTLSFGADQTSRTVAVTVNGDTVDEPDETFAIGLALPVPDEGKVTLGTPSSANATIADDDLPVASVTGGAVGEGGTATFTVTLGLAASEEASVRLDTSDGTAKAPGDYTAVTNHVVTFDPGQTSKTVDVATVDDDVDEDGETVIATLSDPQGARLATGGAHAASATIADGDAAPVATIAGPGTVTEGDGLTPYVVTLSRRSERGAAVRVATTDGTATNPQDIAATPQTLTFGATETARTFVVDVQGDTEDETDETFDVGLAIPAADAGKATLGVPSSVATTITDDDLPVVSISDAAVAEGDTVTFGLTLVRASADPVTVRVDTADGSATAPGDYTPLAGGTVTFQPGQTAATVAIGTIEDEADESDETFGVGLSDASGARIGAGTATGTIGDDDTTVVPPPDGGQPPAPPVVAADSGRPAIPACVVPDLRGRTVNEAAKLLSQSGCILGKVVRTYQKRGSTAARTRKKNRIYATFPAAGARVARNAPVRVTVSRGVKPRKSKKRK